MRRNAKKAASALLAARFCDHLEDVSGRILTVQGTVSQDNECR